MVDDLPSKLAALLAKEKGRFDRTLGEDLRNLRVNYDSGSYTVLLMQQRYEADIEERLSTLLDTLKRLLASSPERAIRDNKPDLDRLAQAWLESHIEDCQSQLNEHAAKIGPEGPGQYDLGLDRFRNALAIELDLLSVTDLSVVHPSVVPLEIKESLDRFRRDYPDYDRMAFLMMRFGKTKAHESIVEGIKAALTPRDIVVLRADDKQYHDDLFPNILTYVYGCRFGVAVFERIETEQFNPNVALEVGYMFALRKDVCLLKDRTLATLHTDLVGKLYREFDPQEPVATISDELSRWLKDKGIVDDIVTQAAEKAREIGFITVDTRPFLGVNGEIKTIGYTEYRTVTDLLDMIWLELRRKAGIPGYSYGKRWILKDQGSGRLFEDIGRNWARPHGMKLDPRLLQDAGIKPGLALEVIPCEENKVDVPCASTE